VGSALVDTYCKCKSIKSSETVFVRMISKNVVSWTAMLVGYGQNGCWVMNQTLIGPIVHQPKSKPKKTKAQEHLRPLSLGSEKEGSEAKDSNSRPLDLRLLRLSNLRLLNSRPLHPRPWN
jgi:pentatricopeptide repeat protein